MSELEKKIQDYESKEQLTFMEARGLTKEDIIESNRCLYHGVRFYRLNAIESIFSSGAIKCMDNISPTFTSFDGVEKSVIIDREKEENCNLGKYVSLIPEVPSLELDIFVRTNIFFAVRAYVDAIKTDYLPYEEYKEMIDKKIPHKHLYSYARHEYLVKDSISLDDVAYIGVDPSAYDGDLTNDVNEVIRLMKAYNINIPFKDVYSDRVIYQQNQKTL